jgi:hypothetical protein
MLSVVRLQSGSKGWQFLNRMPRILIAAGGRAPKPPKIRGFNFLRPRTAADSFRALSHPFKNR